MTPRPPHRSSSVRAEPDLLWSSWPITGLSPPVRTQCISTYISVRSSALRRFWAQVRWLWGSYYQLLPAHQRGGYVALMAVLIVGAASLAIATSLLLTGTDSQRYTLILQQSAQARNQATACAEEALQKIHDDTSYTGTGNLILSQGTCSYTVTNTGGNNRTIDASSTVGTTLRKLQISATIGASSISITSWQEVS